MTATKSGLTEIQRAIPTASLGFNLMPTVMVVLALMVAAAPAQPAAGAFDDHQNMMDQLGVKSLRPGPDPKNQSTFDEATANPYKDSMPEVLRMRDGTPVTQASQWAARRAEIREDFEREVYGRIPASVPKVTWK